jgi:hypothetical protein
MSEGITFALLIFLLLARAFSIAQAIMPPSPPRMAGEKTSFSLSVSFEQKKNYLEMNF